MLKPLITDARNGASIMESSAYSSANLAGEAADDAAAYVRANPDHTAYLVLFALRDQAPEVYQAIDAETRAAVLCDALAHLTYLNDWGYLSPTEPYDGKAAKELLATGEAALPHLLPVLANREPAPLFGSEEATMSSQYGYRRADFAYRYAALIQGQKPAFAAKPADRDAAIDAAREQLAERLDGDQTPDR